MRTSTVDLRTLTPRERQVFYSGYRSGVVVGIDMGREQRMAEEEQAWANMAAFVRRIASTPTFSRLCELRGEHDRAEVARGHERRLGVAQ